MRLNGLSQVMNNLRKWENSFVDKAGTIMDFTMGQAESEAKRIAPWKDHTSNARRSITGSSRTEPGVIIGTLCIGVDYGVYLELSNQGRFRIILPTMDSYRYKFLDNLAKG
jgi:predicted transcriptional regulator YheO